MDTLHLASAGGADDDDKKLRRREQNRLSAQRSYHKKQERLSALRAQVAQLEATYEHHMTAIPPASPASSLLTIPPASAASSPTSGSEDDVAEAKSHAVSPSSPPAAPGHLQQLLASRSQLQSENDALRRRLEDHARFQFRMQSLAAGDDAASPDVTVVHNSVTGSPRFQPRMQMKRPLSVDECYAMGSNGYQYMSKFRFPENYMTTGSQMCGWSDRRVLENGLLTVELRKLFRGRDVEHVARTAWLAVKDARKMDALYSLNMNMHSEIVQHIDDNNVVMYQSFETPERDPSGRETGAVVVMHHVMLLTMFASENGYVIIFCSLDPDRLDESDHIVDLAEEEEAAARGVVKRRRKQWFKKFSWLTFNRVGAADEAFELSYLFTVPPHHGANFYWPLEVILLMLRFEIAAVGPVILLPSSSPECVEEQSLFEELKDENERLADDDDDDDAVVMIENKAVKIEPLTLGGGAVDAAVDADEDMSELFIELFP